jgi:beta-lactamase superfamily II metal-dependent hydrolase
VKIQAKREGQGVVSRLTAIPVGQGDAFYLERAEWSVLVDGGRSRSGFASAFQTATRSNGASVVACTHNDADHATGILGFLEAGFSCGEVNRPGVPGELIG